MKYHHVHHAGNFADVHKHVTLLALLAALQRKDKGFLYLDTHAGGGVYDLSDAAAGREAREGIDRLEKARVGTEEVRAYLAAVQVIRSREHRTRLYPGSPLLAAAQLRPQDRGVCLELVPQEARALKRALTGHDRVRVESADGFERMRAHLPPAERRGLTLIDPPYEETRRDFERVAAAIGDALRRFATGVIAAWYPIKDERDTKAWLRSLAGQLGAEALASELWLYPRDSRVALNGSGMLIVNPPYQLEERMQLWLAELHALLDTRGSGGSRIERLSRPA